MRGRRILKVMPGNVFDVFVVGSADPSAAGETRLAATLSARYGLTLATIAQAVAAKNLRAGHELEPQRAQALIKDLQAMGAVTIIRPSASAAGTARTSDLHGTGPHTLAEATAPATFAPLGPPPAAAAAGGVVDLPPPGEKTPVMLAKRMPLPKVSKDLVPPSGLVLQVAPALELARARSETLAEEPVARSKPSIPTSLREMDGGGESGVAMDEDPRNLNLVRCVQHGLYYDKSKASGCRVCMGAARMYASKIEERAGRFAQARDRPARRAFWGLAVALVIGFLPAAYYCLGPGASSAHRLRTEQELLSRQPGTDANLRRFADLEVQVGDAHRRASRNTAVIWVAVAGVAMLGWYRVT